MHAYIYKRRHGEEINMDDKILKFNQKLSFDKISATLDGMDNRRIVDYLNCTLLAFNIFFEKYPHYI